MKVFLRVLKILAIGLITALGLLYLFVSTGGSITDAAGHLVAGWAFFLSRNIKSLALDPEIVVSGLVAGIVSLFLLHLLGRWLASHFQRHWSIKSSLSIFGFIVVLFATSFLVPGFITVSKLLFSEPMTSRSRSSLDHLYRDQLRTLYFLLLETEGIEEGQPAPTDLDPLIASSRLGSSRPFTDGFANSGFLYLAAGHPPYDHPDFPLFVSPEYSTRGKTVRCIIYCDFRTETIDAKQYERLLKRVVAIRR
ncbi:hypothetical protein ACFQY0_00340 [Haloferula chungangensis]|uniref:Uncharacterized protein n=1 Tax=Haloferula chungangensis TaxID=1048331 RepID=A0ABW2KZY5_9BACT